MPGWIAQALVPALLLNLAALGTAYVIAKGAALEFADRLTVVIELGLKNTTIGMLVALSLIGSVELAIPAAIYGIAMYASAFALVTYGRRRQARELAAAAG